MTSDVERDCNTCKHHTQAGVVDGLCQGCWINPLLPNWEPQVRLEPVDLSDVKVKMDINYGPRRHPLIQLKPAPVRFPDTKVAAAIVGGTALPRPSTNLMQGDRRGLPTDSQQRKGMPIVRGCLDYFPDALLAVAEMSRIANEKHNPGQPMHWSKGKSDDHADCAVRHLMERGNWDTTMSEPVRHSTAAAWRALANLQTEIERERNGSSNNT